MTNRRLPRLGLAALVAATVALVYGLAVWTPAGQAFDRAVLALDSDGHSALSEFVADLLDAVFIPATGLALVGLVVIATGTRRIAVTALAALAGLLSAATAEVLKVSLPGRPGDPTAPLSSPLDLVDPGWWARVRDGTVILSGSFPSAHATVATALALALLTAVAPRFTKPLAIPLLMPAAAVSVATVVAGWHRPSDALAGMLLALAWWLAVVPAATLHQAVAGRATTLPVAGWTAQAHASIEPDGPGDGNRRAGIGLTRGGPGTNQSAKAPTGPGHRICRLDSQPNDSGAMAAAAYAGLRKVGIMAVSERLPNQVKLRWRAWGVCCVAGEPL